MLSNPPPLQSPRMFTPGFSPLNSPRRRPEHERNTSETIRRPRPISIAAYPTMQPTPTPVQHSHHAKRGSIYVSDASVILAQRTPMMSPMSPHDGSSSESSDFMDHYAILELQPSASPDDITSAFRRLRANYFMSDAKKYKALTAAFDVLRDPDAREAYNVSYYSHKAASGATGSLDEIMELSKHERKDSAMGDDKSMQAVAEEDEIALQRSQDPNWALKRFEWRCEPVIGSEPYQSYIPLPTTYQGGKLHPRLNCRSPTYIGYLARRATPY